MFYEIRNALCRIEPKDIDPEVLTVGCISSEELTALGKNFGFDDDTIAASQKANPMFRTGVDVHEKYTFTEVRIVNRDGHEDFVSVYIKKNFILIVDIVDADNSTTDSFLKAVRKYPCARINAEKIPACITA